MINFRYDSGIMFKNNSLSFRGTLLNIDGWNDMKLEFPSK